MTYQNWLPTFLHNDKDNKDNPLMSFRQQMDALFEDFDQKVLGNTSQFAVRSNTSETDEELCITAELPGIEEKDVDISVTGNHISIKGEKKSEQEEKSDEEGRQFHRIERSSGFFQRTMALPFEIDPDAVKATVENGVLTVTIQKPAEVQEKTKKIEITK